MTGETISVFLADDHAMVREGLAEIVAKDSSVRMVGQCGDGLKVFDMVRDLRPDVVVLDISMPGLNGLDICRQISRKLRDTAVLILTMHNQPDFVAKALEYGAAGYLVKEAAAGLLAEALHRVARGEVYLGPGIARDALEHVGKPGFDPYERLSTRERQVLQLIAEGRTNRVIAEQLHLAVKTVDTHRTRLMKKLNIHDQTTLVKYAVRKGIVRLE